MVAKNAPVFLFVLCSKSCVVRVDNESFNIFYFHHTNKLFRFSSLYNEKPSVFSIFLSCRTCVSKVIGCIEVTSFESSVGTEAVIQLVAWTM